MLLRARCLSFFTKAPLLRFYHASRFQCPFLHYRSSFKPINARVRCINPLPMNKSAHFCTRAVPIGKPSSPTPSSNKARKKARRESPEGLLQHKLNMCSKSGDLVEALRLYDDARVNHTPLTVHHYNVLLYLCSSPNGTAASEAQEGLKDVCSLGFERGFEIFKQMRTDQIAPNEATFTSAARLAASKEDPEMAFDLVKQMKGCGIPPKLRSYGPALFGFCKKGMADEAYEVDAHMVETGVSAEEPELSALLKVSSDAKMPDKVYEMLHRLRATVRQVSEETARVVEDWFNSESGAEVGEESWDAGKVREGVVKGGGGWHGQGWLGTGKWRVVRTVMDEAGVCRSCGEKLVCIDIDPKETEIFASSLTSLACQREVKADFMQFQV